MVTPATNTACHTLIVTYKVSINNPKSTTNPPLQHRSDTALISPRA